MKNIFVLRIKKDKIKPTFERITRKNSAETAKEQTNTVNNSSYVNLEKKTGEPREGVACFSVYSVF